MPKKERLAKENTAKKEIVAKGTKKITCLFKPQLSNEIMYFKFSQHSDVPIFLSEAIHNFYNITEWLFLMPLHFDNLWYKAIAVPTGALG